jgi:hypothetical protein
MSITQRVAELERERDEQWTALEKATARIAGIDAELQRLKAGTASSGSLASARLTDGILVVLRTAGTTLSPTEIQHGLARAGRTEPLNKVTSTLTHLKNRGQVILEGRGKYRSM